MIICDLCGNKMKLKYHSNNKEGKKLKYISQYALYDDIYLCKCGLVKQKEIIDISSFNNLLTTEKYLDKSIGILAINEKKYQFIELLKIVNSHIDIQNKNILDVGSNTGIFMEFVKNKYKINKIVGIEPSLEASDYCIRNGLEIKNSIIEETFLTENYFDLVTMWDVIEHLSNPISDLHKIYGWMKPGGKLFISTHNINSLFSIITGKYYPMLMYQHLYHWNPNSISKALNNAGFKVESKCIYIQKCWTVEYLYHLLKELWPNSYITKFIHKYLKFLFMNKFMAKIKIIFPINDFFVIVAVK